MGRQDPNTPPATLRFRVRRRCAERADCFCGYSEGITKLLGLGEALRGTRKYFFQLKNKNKHETHGSSVLLWFMIHQTFLAHTQTYSK